ncbi:MAG: NAD(+) synthase, partial [Methylococcales bacterium]|nr:NAD(+) synthase [Methylococcales bacterium]
MKLILAQLNYIVGDIEGNALKILQAYETGRSEDGLLICSELALTGYYPQDLVYQTDFLSRQDKMLAMLAEATEGYMGGMVVGMIARNESGTGKRLYNALVVLQNGQQTFEYHKRLLPTYNVFDEARHFKSGENSAIFNYRGFRIGVLICEDAWVQSGDFVYAHDPVKALANHTLDLVISLNASPSNLGKLKERQIIISKVANELDVPVVYVNQVGGNDELVFDGASFIVNRQGQIVFQLTAFEEQIAAIELNKIEHSVAVPYSLNDSELFYRQTVLGIKDYVQKCGFSQVVIGSSGGIDSAVTLAICTEALGAENMTAITMPSPFSSKGSVDDSRDLCENLGVKLLFSSIAEEFELAKKQFEQMTGEVPSSLTLENIQARIRGRKLMEYSNHYGALVVSTGNKSEMSVGYATLYGDMNGGINPL